MTYTIIKTTDGKFIGQEIKCDQIEDLKLCLEEEVGIFMKVKQRGSKIILQNSNYTVILKEGK